MQAVHAGKRDGAIVMEEEKKGAANCPANSHGLSERVR